MPQRTDIFDLARLGLTSGEGRRLDLHVAVDRFEYGGPALRGRARRWSPVRLDVSRTTGNGWALRLRFEAALQGPCMRCLEPGRRRTSRSTPARSTSPAAARSSSSPYVDATASSTSRPGRATRSRSRCRPRSPAARTAPACAPECGANLNEDPDHAHEAEPDPRWAKLSELTASTDVRYPSAPPMAVPKQKQSHARTTKRRVAAQDHRAGGERVPAVPPAAPPAPGVPALRLLRRSRGRARARPRSRPRALGRGRMAERSRSRSTRTGPTSVPREVARGAALAAAARASACCCSARRPRSAGRGGVEVVDAPVSIAKAADPARAVRRRPRPRSCRPSRPSPTGRADALVSGGSTGAALAAALFRFKRARGVHRPALAILVPVPGAPFLLLDAGANVEVRPEHLVQFAHMGAAFMEVVMGVRAPARGAARPTARSPTEGRRTSSPPTRRWPSARRPELRRQRRGLRDRHGRADVIVTDGFTGNVALKVMEGTSDALLRAVRDGGDVVARARKLGGLLLRPALRGLRDEIDPEAQGGAVLLGLRQLGVVPHGSFGARGFARAIEVAARGVREDVVGRTHERLAEAGALRRASERPRPPLPCPTSHDPRRGPRADPRAPGRRAGARPRARRGVRRTSARTSTPTRSTSTRWCRSSRTPTACKMSDEQAAQIQTVGQAVDFVLGTCRPPSASRPDRCASSTTCSNGCRTTSPGRRSRTPRGRSAAPTPTSGSPSWATPCSAWRSRRTCTRGWRPTRYGAGRLTKIRAQAVSGRSCRAVAERLGLPERLRAAAPPDVARAGDGAAGAHRARARVGDRGRDRRLLPGLRLRGDRRGGGRGVRAGDRAGARRARPTSSRRCRSASRAAGRS